MHLALEMRLHHAFLDMNRQSVDRATGARHDHATDASIVQPLHDGIGNGW